jgi:hypothetical protein
MNWRATIANSLWISSSVAALVKFQRAVRRPAETQRDLLHDLLARNAECEYGRAHGFDSIRSYKEFAQRVPMVDYDDLEPWIERIRRREFRLLTSEPTTHLIPTSGSTGRRKLIPFTNGLQQEFDAAIGAWIGDLARQHPGISRGPAYWSITPTTQSVELEPSVVPIGFADDASYLGGVKSWLVRAAMVVPNGLSQTANLEEFHYRTLLCLLRQRDLRLISIWHPSFLTLLLDAVPVHWEKLMTDLRRIRSSRARELERANPRQPETLWPKLRVISCWGDGHAELALGELRRRFPQVYIQPKGLLATEAFVTIPFAGQHPVAVRSHFFEFMDDAGQIHLLEDLREGESYEVIVTTAGGLWRYRLGDQVRVNGFVERTPSMRFMGRKGNISDLCGEKLSESFVATAIQKVTASMNPAPQFVTLAPEKRADGWHYTLFVEGELDDAIASTRLEQELRANPHYALCRELGQLQPLQVFQIADKGHETFLRFEMAAGKRLGNVKTSFLSQRSDWASFFIGQQALNSKETKISLARTWSGV